MIEKVVEEGNLAGGLTAIPKDNVYSHIASYMNRALEQARYLTPIHILINSSMTDPRLIHVGGIFLNAFQSAAIIYVVLTCMFCMLTFPAYKKARR